MKFCAVIRQHRPKNTLIAIAFKVRSSLKALSFAMGEREIYPLYIKMAVEPPPPPISVRGVPGTFHAESDHNPVFRLKIS